VDGVATPSWVSGYVWPFNSTGNGYCPRYSDGLLARHLSRSIQLALRNERVRCPRQIEA
jgi:hypothetical protein